MDEQRSERLTVLSPRWCECGGRRGFVLLLLPQVNRAVDYVGGGTKALVEAKQYQKSKRKWCCCAIVTLLVILIIVFVVVSCLRLCQ